MTKNEFLALLFTIICLKRLLNYRGNNLLSLRLCLIKRQPTISIHKCKHLNFAEPLKTQTTTQFHEFMKALAEPLNCKFC